MAFETSQYLKLTRVAGADLTAGQYKFVKLDAAGAVVLCTATTDKPIGVLQNAPRLTEEAEVLISGVTKVVTAAALAIDAVIGTDAASLASALTVGTDTTAYAMGRIITATGAANEIGTAVIDGAVPNRAS